jgi:GH24 family phage-related lysozyme (muramidase)
MEAVVMATLIGMAAALVRAEEGLSLVAYDDATGHPIRAGSRVEGNPTIGWGHRCDAPVGITRAHADALLTDDLAAAGATARAYAGEAAWAGLGDPRRAALTDLAFNVGADGIRKFAHLHDALAVGDWERAGAEVEDSRLSPARKARLAGIMRSGAMPADTGFGAHAG